MITSPTPDISVKIVDLPIPILKYPRWMEVSYPDDIKEKELVKILEQYLKTAEELAEATQTQQIKIPTDPKWQALEDLGFSKAVYHMTTTPETLSKVEPKPVTVTDTALPSDIRDLIVEQFKYHAAYNPDYYTSDIETNVDEFIQHAETMLKQGKAFLLIAEQDKSSIGFIYGEFEADYGNIDELFVVEDERGKGVGTALMQKSAPLYRQLNCDTVGAYVAFDAPAMKFYETRGFGKDFLSWIKNIS